MALETTIAPRSRDASKTRELLLHAARRRFAYDGYSATTVREIASEAGVNVALINRYFTSKEGLFEACLAHAVVELDKLDADRSNFDGMMRSFVSRVADPPTGEHSLQLLLLLRSSGDERADLIRQDTLRSYTERMAGIAGWSADDPSSQHLLLRAQIAIATGFGIVLLRASTKLEPMASAAEGDLAGPLGDVVAALLHG